MILKTIVLSKIMQNQLSFLSPFVHSTRKSSCHMEILAIFFVAFLIGKMDVQKSYEKLLLFYITSKYSSFLISLDSSFGSKQNPLSQGPRFEPGWIHSKTFFFYFFTFFDNFFTFQFAMFICFILILY